MYVIELQVRAGPSRPWALTTTLPTSSLQIVAAGPSSLTQKPLLRPPVDLSDTPSTT